MDLPGPAKPPENQKLTPRLDRAAGSSNSTKVQQRKRPGTPPTGHRQPASCPNDLAAESSHREAWRAKAAGSLFLPVGPRICDEWLWVASYGRDHHGS